MLSLIVLSGVLSEHVLRELTRRAPPALARVRRRAHADRAGGARTARSRLVSYSVEVEDQAERRRRTTARCYFLKIAPRASSRQLPPRACSGAACCAFTGFSRRHALSLRAVREVARAWTRGTSCWSTRRRCPRRCRGHLPQEAGRARRQRARARHRDARAARVPQDDEVRIDPLAAHGLARQAGGARATSARPRRCSASGSTTSRLATADGEAGRTASRPTCRAPPTWSSAA